LGNPQRIDEAINETVVTIGDRRIADRFDDRLGSHSALVAGVVTKACQTLRRKDRPLAGLPESCELASNEAESASLAAVNEVQQIVRSGLSELPPRYRLALCVEYGIPDALDPQMGIPRPQERRNDIVLFRARRRLRDLLRQKYPNIDALF
jgi:hypothetical protein